MSDDEEPKPDSGDEGGKSEPPKYTIYRAGSDSKRKADPPDKAKRPSSADSEGPGYTVYRSRRGPLAALRNADLSGLREKLKLGGGDAGAPEPAHPDGSPTRPPWRKIAKWVAIGAAFWLALSMVLFVISAQIQKGKLSDGAGSELGGNPLLVATGQTILVMGTDARPAESNEPGAETSRRCIKQGAAGDPPSSDCKGFRADTLLLVRAGGGAFRKLSIPRDAYADVPGSSAQKINGAYALGGAELQIKTVESFLGIEVDHAVILDFDGFADFIDSIGGVEVALRAPVKAKFNCGDPPAKNCAALGGTTLDLPRGKSTLNGADALALARVRRNLKDPNENDLQRAERQQLILQGIKNRLTSPTRLPYNFFKGPWIAWNAPKAMVSDMGGLLLPQLAMAAAIGGDSSTQVLGLQATNGPGGSLVIPASECAKAVRKFIGSNPDGSPACSPGG